MKKFFVCLFAAFTLLGTGCSKDDDNNSPASKATATIDGKEYSFGDYVWEFQNNHYMLFTESLVQDNSLTIKLKEKKTGDIVINSDNGIEIGIGDVTYTANEGTISVTSFDDKTIIGTFKGTFKNGLLPAKTIAGKFSASKEK